MPHLITESCIGCTMCARNCPVEAISGALKQPHHINPIRCVDCSACGRVCPTASVQDSFGNTVAKTPRSEWAKPRIDPQKCSACRICVNICGLDCIEISLPKFKGDLRVFAELQHPEKCAACGLCASTCPLHAITMEGGAGQ